METIIGYISGVLVFLSGLIYIIRIYQKKITPNLVTWGIWAIMGLAILLSYKSSGAKESVWPAISGAINPSLIVILAFFRKHKSSFSLLDILCGAFGFLSILWWGFTQGNPDKVQYALYIALLADLLAIIPTIIWVTKNPWEDRPAMWILFSLGYGLGIFSIKEQTFTNYLLPVWMLVMTLPVWIPLVKYRLKNKIPISEWI
ncbi:MAG: hypothetical protein AABY32_07030 [Nanoarchaeota archaeon]